jgi:cytosine/adenosine deaminase-related metal-dependent hydrolase
MVALPGLVNAHVHSHGVLSKAVVEGFPLEVWSHYAKAGRELMSEEDVRYACLLASVELMRAGVSTVLDHPYYDRRRLDACAKAWGETGLRVVVAPSIADKGMLESIGVSSGDDSAPGPMEEDPAGLCESFARDWSGAFDGRLRVMYGPSAPHRCSDGLLRRVADGSSRSGLGVHLHLLETRTQARICRQSYERGVVRHLDSLGLLNPRTSLVHCVWLDPEEIEVIARSGASVVHVPASNLLLGSGIAPVKSMVRAGVNVCLGTDGPNCGGSLDLRDSMRLALLLHRVTEGDYEDWPSARSVFQLGTRNGAYALGLDAPAPLGVLREGAKADIALFDLRNKPEFVPNNDLLLQFILAGSVECETLVVDGEVIYTREGGPARFEEAEIMETAGRLGTDLIRRSRALYDGAERVRRLLHAVAAKDT